MAKGLQIQMKMSTFDVLATLSFSASQSTANIVCEKKNIQKKSGHQESLFLYESTIHHITEIKYFDAYKLLSNDKKKQLSSMSCEVVAYLLVIYDSSDAICNTHADLMRFT